MGFVKENARSQDNLPFLTLNVKNIIQITSSTGNITGKPRPVFIPADSKATHNYKRNTFFSIAETVFD